MFASSFDVSVKGCGTAHDSLVTLSVCMSHELSLLLPSFCPDVTPSVVVIVVAVVVESACVFFFLASWSSRFCFLHFALRFLNQT